MSGFNSASLAELGLLTASLVHEIRQPLFAIKAHTQLARAEGGENDEALRQIERGVEYIEEMLGHYSGLGELQTGPARSDLRSGVQCAVELLAYRSRQAGVTLEVTMPSEEVCGLARRCGTANRNQFTPKCPRCGRWMPSASDRGEGRPHQ